MYMKMITRGILYLAALSLLTACSYDEMIEKYEPKQESLFAKQILVDLKAKNIAEVKKHLSKDIPADNIDAQLNTVAEIFPAKEPVEIKTIGVSTNNNVSSGIWSADLTYQYRYDPGWLLATVSLERKGEGDLVVSGVHVKRMERSLEEINAFTLQGKSVIHYIYLVLAIVIPLLVLYSLVLCFKTPMVKRKWLWVIFILLGFVTFKINWTTGATYFVPVSFQLFGASVFSASPYAPWVLGISIPVGAIVFLLKRWRMKPEIAES